MGALKLESFFLIKQRPIKSHGKIPVCWTMFGINVVAKEDSKHTHMIS